VRLLDDVRQRGVVVAKLRGDAAGGVVGSSGALAERGLKTDQREGLPAETVIALVAARAARLREPIVAARGEHLRSIDLVQAMALCDLVRPRRCDGAALGVGDDDRDVALVAAEVLEHRRQFGREVEAQQHRADRRAARVDDAVGEVVRCLIAVEQRAALAAFHMAGAAQHRRPPIGQVFCVPAGVGEPHEHAAVGGEHDDVAVHGVLGAVLREPGAQLTRGRVARCAHEVDERRIGGDEAHVGGALEQVAHEDVDRHLGA
jgi:hypothetical protein